MRPALAIARKDLRERLRDRSAIVVGIIAPVAIAGLMSLAFRGFESFSYTLGVVNLDKGPVASGLVQALETPELREVIHLRQIGSVAAARAEIGTGELDAGLVVPPGLSASVTGPHPESLVTVSSAENPIAGQVTRSVAGSFVAQVNADRLSVLTAIAAGAPASSATELAALAAKLHIPVEAVQQPVGAHELKLISYYSPGMAIFFLLFMISYTARSFFVDRSEGMIERIRAAPVRPAEILLGKALSVLVYGAVSLGTIALVTTVAFGANWGSPLPAVLVGLALVLAVVALTALVVGLSRTQRQAEGVSSIVVFGLALLGGNFFFVSSAPGIMKQLALFTPNGWTMRAYTDLSTIGGGLSTVAEPVFAILALTAVIGAVAMVLAPRAVRS